MDSRLKEVIGGVYNVGGNTQQTMWVSGGFTYGLSKKLNHIENQVIIGNIAKNFVKDKILTWETFKNIYYEKRLLDPIYYEKFIDVLNNIFPLPIYTNDDNELLFLVSQIYKANDDEIINALIKMVNIHESFKNAIRYLFMSYKMYLENLIELCVNLREEYIAKENLTENVVNNFENLIQIWNKIDIDNNIDTSSPILFFNFPKHVKMEETIPKIRWDIKGAKININKLVEKFLKQININDFQYPGYCPHVAVKRLLQLLKFPTGELLDIIYMLSVELKHNKYLKLKFSCDGIIKAIHNIKPDIPKITQNTMKQKFKRKKMPGMSKFPSKYTISNKIKLFESYVDVFIELYKTMIPYLVKKEKFISDVSIKINLISKDIQNITNVI